MIFFVFQEVLVFVQAQVCFFANCFLIFFSVSNLFHFTIEQPKGKGHEKRDRLLISKMDFNF